MESKVLRRIAFTGLAWAAFTTTGLHASSTAAPPASEANKAQALHVQDNTGKPTKTRTTPKRTLGTNPAMPLWEGPWGPHH
jgi:hypothetical protein